MSHSCAPPCCYVRTIRRLHLMQLWTPRIIIKLSPYSGKSWATGWRLWVVATIISTSIKLNSDMGGFIFGQNSDDYDQINRETYSPTGWDAGYGSKMIRSMDPGPTWKKFMEKKEE